MGKAMTDDRAFLSLFLKYRESLWNFIRSLVRDYHRCEDIFQQVALILWERFPSYQPGTSFRAWSRTTALNVVRHVRRDQARLVELSPEAVQAVMDAFARIEKEETVEDTEVLAVLRECVEQLSPDARGIIDLRYGKGLELRRLARQARTTIAAISMKLTRIRRYLRQCVQRRLARAGGA